jgi:hypothetical protein
MDCWWVLCLVSSLTPLTGFVGIHDAFELYGRPKAYTWDPRDSLSLMFAYPIGQHKDVSDFQIDPLILANSLLSNYSLIVKWRNHLIPEMNVLLPFALAFSTSPPSECEGLSHPPRWPALRGLPQSRLLNNLEHRLPHRLLLSLLHHRTMLVALYIDN